MNRAALHKRSRIAAQFGFGETQCWRLPRHPQHFLALDNDHRIWSESPYDVPEARYLTFCSDRRVGSFSSSFRRSALDNRFVSFALATTTAVGSASILS